MNRKPSPPIDPAPGRRLKDLRIARGMTQAQLAEPQYGKAYISALEGGKIRFSMAAGAFLAERLGVTLVDLLDGGETVALRIAAKEAADWMAVAQATYHVIAQGFPNETRQTCEAGLCRDLRTHRDALYAALGEAA